jgi:hypothetical protein
MKHTRTVVLSSPSKLSDAEKLEALRRLDLFRPWHSLDDKRYCLVCGKIITGKQIQVSGGTRGNGPLRIDCPTERCHSIPFDWVLPTDEIMANLVRQEAEHSDVPAFDYAADYGAHENSIAARLRKLAVLFKRSA